MNKALLAAGAILALGFSAIPASAAVQFVLQGDLQSNPTEPGLVVSNTGYTDVSDILSLDQGESLMFNMGRMWTDESAVDADDFTLKTAFAGLQIGLPSAEGSYELWGGWTWGSDTNGVVQQGNILWVAPVRQWAFDNDNGLFQFELFPGQFNTDFYKLAPGEANGWDVFAKVTLVKDPFAAAVPEPASWVMLIAGFGLVGGVMRRQRHNNTYVRHALA